MTKGELVKMRVRVGYLTDAVNVEWGAVLDYRPCVLGGSSHFSGGIITTPKRGEVLVLSYNDGSMSWYDESNVFLVHETVSGVE